ncbi:MAG: cytochrome c [Terriglobales bacterium]
MKKLLFAVLLLALVVPSTSFAADLAADANYKAKCAGCHGPAGEGGKIAKKPLKEAAAKSDAELTKIIEEGTPNTTPKMPGYKDKLTADQIKSMVAEIKALK